MSTNSERQTDFIRCIFNEDKLCLRACPYYSIAEAAYESRQPEYLDELRKLGFSDKYISNVAYNIKYPAGLGRTVKFYDLQLTECSCYKEQNSWR